MEDDPDLLDEEEEEEENDYEDNYFDNGEDDGGDGDALGGGGDEGEALHLSSVALQKLTRTRDFSQTAAPSTERDPWWIVVCDAILYFCLMSHSSHSQARKGKVT